MGHLEDLLPTLLGTLRTQGGIIEVGALLQLKERINRSPGGSEIASKSRPPTLQPASSKWSLIRATLGGLLLRQPENPLGIRRPSWERGHWCLPLLLSEDIAAGQSMLSMMPANLSCCSSLSRPRTEPKEDEMDRAAVSPSTVMLTNAIKNPMVKRPTPSSSSFWSPDCIRTYPSRLFRLLGPPAAAFTSWPDLSAPRSWSVYSSRGRGSLTAAAAEPRPGRRPSEAGRESDAGAARPRRVPRRSR